MAKRATTGNDTLWAGKKAAALSGLAGDDTITGGGGGDTLSGDAGNDLLTGGAGGNLLQGGNGTDTVSYKDYGDAAPLYVNLALGYAVDQVGLNGAAPASGTGQSINDTIFAVENVTGAQDTTNWLIGDVNANQFSGGGLADTLEGGAGDDSLVAGAGSDTIDGGAGRDVVSGGEGDDTFIFAAGDGVFFFGNSIPPAADWDFYVGATDEIIDLESGDKIIVAYEPDDIAIIQWLYDADTARSFVRWTNDGDQYYSILVQGQVTIDNLGFIPLA